MDELEILKKDWKKKEHSYNQLSEQQIYAMLHKNSSSIVKWILVISVVEILFWSSLSFFTTDDTTKNALKIWHLDTFLPIASTINYVVVVFFIYQFYKNYKRINTTESVKQLMNTILKTKKIVTYYVWYNLAMIFVTFIVFMGFQFKYDPKINEMITKSTTQIDPNIFYIGVFLGYMFFIAIILFLFWLFYKLLYGILLKRLSKNYAELKKLDF